MKKTLLFVFLLTGLVSCMEREKLELPTPAATCSDGIRNQGEEAIDCGGPCTDCYTEPVCTIEENTFETEVGNGGYYGDCYESFDYFSLSGDAYSDPIDLEIILPGKPAESAIYTIDTYSTPGEGEARVTITVGQYFSTQRTYVAQTGSVNVKVEEDGTVSATFCDLIFSDGSTDMRGSGNITVNNCR